jgi:hypothetical protein
MQMMCQSLKRAAFIETNQSALSQTIKGEAKLTLAPKKGFIKCPEGA